MQAEDRIGGCTVIVRVGSNEGYEATITATEGDFSTSSPFTVYFPIDFSISVDDEARGLLRTSTRLTLNRSIKSARVHEHSP